MKLLYCCCFILIAGVSIGQENALVEKYKLDTFKLEGKVLVFPGQSEFNFLSASQSTTFLQSNIYEMPTLNHLPGLFCKLEYQLESKSKLAPRFRLGSLYYTEWMEGKRDYYMRYYK